jgi:hypothetical protein
MVRRLFVLLALLALPLLTGCRQSAQATPTPEANVDIALTVDPDPPAVGKSELVIVLTDDTGAPVDGATVNVRGDMNHAGMTPVQGATDVSDGGVYRIPFDWTMGGDWILTVSVALPGGETASRAFNLSVAT